MSSPRYIRWLLILLMWLALAMVNATQIVLAMQSEGMRHDWMHLWLSMLVQWAIWPLVTPLVMALAHQVPIRRDLGWSAAFHALAFLFVWLVHALWVSAAFLTLKPYGTSSRTLTFWNLVASMLRDQVSLVIVFYALIVAITFMLDSQRRLAERETEAAQLAAQLSRAQLDSLRRQLEPHFLFNALHGIAGLVRDRRNDEAVGMIAGLSDLLRHVLDHSPQQQVPLADELDFIHRYLEIQRMRFGERLAVIVDVPDLLRTAPVPNLILQPLVENAIQHGLGRRVEGGTVRVTASHDQGVLSVTVWNDGPLLTESAVGQEGIGLRNTRARLQSLYGGAGALRICNSLDGVEALLTIPWEPAT